METVLVTGAAGFIGSTTVELLLRDGYRVIGLDNFDPVYDVAFKKENIESFLNDSNFTFIEGDIRDFSLIQELFKKEQPEYVIHLAARADTRKAVEEPREYISVNIEGTLNILECAKEGKVKNVVIASSSSVYGNNPELPWREDDQTDFPISPYGATKKAVEHLAYTYHHNFGLSVTCLRYFNAFGERNRPGMVPYLWAEALLRGEEIELSGDGSRKRDYTYVGDIARGTLLAMKKPLGFEIINLGYGSPLSLRELLSLFESALGVTAQVRSRESSHASVETTYANTEKAEKLLGWKPEISHEEGIKRLLAWFREYRLK